MLPTYYHFLAPIIFEVSGKDSERYLQSRTTNNIKTLKINDFLNAAILSPQGRTEGFFTIIRKTELSFILYSLFGEYDQIISSFLKFKVADRVEVKDLRNELSLFHLSDEGYEELVPAVESLGFKKYSDTTYLNDLTENNFALKSPVLTPAGLNVLINKDRTDTILDKFEELDFMELSENEFQYFRILNNYPIYPYELNDTTVFLEANLKEAISFNKGCYVGQEVVEKVDSHGRLSKKLSRIKFEKVANFEKLAKIKLASDEDETIGKIYSSSISPDNTYTIGFAAIDSEIEANTKIICNKVEGIII